jgi:tetratricopeptide (TPR) repeat protein
MKSLRVLSIACIVFIGIFTMQSVGYSQMEEGKIPVTTKSPEALQEFLKGRDLFERLQGQESLKYLKQALEKDPDFAMAYLFSSFSQPIAQKFFEYQDKAVALKNKVSEGERLWIEGVKAATNGFPLKQREIYQNLVKLYPKDERAHNLLGNNYFGTQEYEKAIAEYKQVIQLNPQFSQAYNQMGYAYRFLKNYEEAEKSFKKYIELIPDNPNPYDSFAELLMKTGKFEESIKYYNKALEVNPNFVASHIGIATDYNFLGKYEKARAQLQKLFGMARNEGEQRAARFAMTVSYIDEGKMDEAMKELDWQYKLGERTHDAANMAGDLIFMGNVLFEHKKYDDAMDKYKKALEYIEKSDLSTEVKDNARRAYLYNSARVDLMQDKMESAKTNAEEFLARVEAVHNTFQGWLAHEVLGMIAMKEARYDAAIREFQLANQQNPYTLYRLALAYKAAGNKDLAHDFALQAANHNTLNSLQYAFVREKASRLAERL